MSQTAQNNVNITNSVLQFRQDFAIISNWVSFGSKVLDLGCGDGAMLEYLQVDKQCSGYGVEIDDARIPRCLQRGSACQAAAACFGRHCGRAPAAGRYAHWAAH